MVLTYQNIMHRNYKQISQTKRRVKSRKGTFSGRRKADTVDNTSTNEGVITTTTTITTAPPVLEEVIQGTSSELAGPSTTTTTPTVSVIPVPNVHYSTPGTSSESGTKKVFKTLRNKTKEKLKNSSFSILEASPSKSQKNQVNNS